MHVAHTPTASRGYWLHALSSAIRRTGFPTVAEANGARECAAALLAAGSTPAEIAELVRAIKDDAAAQSKPVNGTLCTVIAAALLARPRAADNRALAAQHASAQPANASAGESILHFFCLLVCMSILLYSYSFVCTPNAQRLRALAAGARSPASLDSSPPRALWSSATLSSPA